MSMVDSMETSYTMHSHTRSLSSIASTILPIASDASTYTSVTASPMEPQDLDTLPIELKIPLPTSSRCSIKDLQALQEGLEVPRNHLSAGDSKSQHDPKGSGDHQAMDSDLQNEHKDGFDQSETSGISNVSLDDLAQLVDTEQFQRRRAFSATSQLDKQSITCGLNRRLSSTMMIAYGNLIDQYKGNDQAGFAGLYESLEKVKEMCNQEALAARADESPSDSDLLGENLDPEDHQSWTQQLPADDQKYIVDFLTRVRTDPDFLANRIASLEPPKLAALTSSYHPAGVDLSVLANHSHGMTQFYSQDSQMMKLSRRMDNLQHFHEKDPFFTLIYCLFDTTATAGSLEYARRNDVWSSTCAKVITDRRPGGDELIMAAADAFMSFEDWKLKPQLELYLQTVLVEGSFLLDPLVNVSLNSYESLESKNASHAVRVANFFENALNDLFHLIASVPHKEALPNTAQDFVQSTIRKIQDPQMQLRAKQFLISRWYFASFLSSALVYPELQGLLMTHHIGEGARQNILKQIVIRMQAQVFDVLLSRADDMLVTLERRVQILAISNYFEPLTHDLSQGPPEESHTRYIGDTQAYQLMLSHQDLSGLVQALYPNNPVPENPMEPLTAMHASAPPSTTSSSTLRPGSSDISSNASSVGPNYSGSSVNSEATITGSSQAGPHGVIDSLSHKSSKIGANTTNDISDLDPSKLASQLGTLHAKLQAITRNGVDQPPGATSRSRWAIFLIHSNGTVSLKPSAPPSELFVPDESAYQSNGSAFNHWTLKGAIVTLLANQGPYQNGKSYCARFSSPSQDPLRTLLEDALAESRLSMKFGIAHYWYRCIEIYSNLAISSDGRNCVQDLQNAIGREIQISIDSCIKRAQASESLIRSLSFLGKQQRATLSILESKRKALRIKMWYVSDVRHSSTYEEALLVTKALRAMSAHKRSRQPASTFTWARQRLRGALSQERADAQTLETMTASKDCGGRSKLADDQVEMTSRWLTRTGIENFCRGEERIHRFCHEVQKSVGKLAGASLLESPVLWSSHLFKREKAAFDSRSPRAGVAPSSGLYTPLNFSYGGSWASLTSMQPSLQPMTSPISVGAHSTGHGHSFGFHPGSQGIFMSPSMSQASRSAVPGIQYPHGMAGNATTTRIDPRHNSDEVLERASSKKNTMAKEVLVKNIKDALYGLLASDLGYLLWDQGSETDAWINKAAAEEQVDEKSALDTVRSSLEVQTGVPQQNNIAENPSGVAGRTSRSQELSNAHIPCDKPKFGFSDAYQTLLRRMSTTCDPFIKLEMLSQLENLVVNSLQGTFISNGTEPSPQNETIGLQSEPMSRSKSVPRTKATSLEEVVANCTERRAGTIRATHNLDDVISTDAIVNHLLTIFRDSQLRPTNLFLSLQYIAAFISPYTLDHTAHGKAFWDCSLAALALKEDLCNSTVRRAAEITNAYITTKPTSPPYPSQQEAAKLWLVAAKEGSPVAARELALFYLTHPHLLPQRVTMPLSKTRDVFKSVKAGDGGLAGGEKERGILDPLTFDVVHHWMEIAANGGDGEARAFLRQGAGHD